MQVVLYIIIFEKLKYLTRVNILYFYFQIGFGQLTHSEDLPRPYDPVVEGVDHVEHVRLPESHFALLRFFIIEMRPEEKT